MKCSSSMMRMWSRLGPSGSLGAAAMEIGKLDENVIFLTADMTFASGLERFKNTYPDRLINIGIAEQNLIGIAAGMASEGYKPFAVTYSSFLATRALDQVKMCLGYMRQPVKLIGINGGFAAGILGPTHMAIEDIAAMRSIPNITIVAPADMTELVKAVMVAVSFDGPMYIRFTGDMNQPAVYSDDYEFRIGEAVKLAEGEDVAIIGCGTLVSNCCLAAELLQQKGIKCSVINMHTIKPLDTKAIDKVRNSKMIVTVEEHSVLGGLGGAVSEYLSSTTSSPALLKLGVNDYYPHAGSYSYLIKENGLDPEGIANIISERWGV